MKDVDVFYLDYDTILAGMYALTVSAKGDCYLYVPPDPGIEAPALGASESALSGIVPAAALHTFTLDSSASRCFFRDSTTVTPLSAPVAVSLTDPSGGLVFACSSTILSSGGVRIKSVAAPCSCCLLSHQTLLWHHRLGHPSLPRLRGMHSRFLVSGLPRSLPPLPPSPAPPCLPCVKGRRRAAPHFSSFPPTSAPLQTLHMDVWGPACVSGQSRAATFCWTFLDRGGEFSSDLFEDLCRGDSTSGPCLLVLELAYTALDGGGWRCIGVPGPPPVDPLPPQGPAPLGVSQVDPLPLAEPVKVTVDSGTARGGAARGIASGGAKPTGAEPGGAEPESAESGGAEPVGADSGGAKPESAEPGGAEPEGAESGVLSLRVRSLWSRQREPLSPQQLHEWFARHTRLRSGAAGVGGPAVGGTRAGDTGVAIPGGAGGTAGAGGIGGVGDAGPGGVHTRGTGAAGVGGVGGAGAGDPGAGGAGAGGTGAGDPRAGGAGAGGAGAGGAGARDTGVGGATRI
ncbi:unnamed protein product [Closterium sp. NIES-54]